MKSLIRMSSLKVLLGKPVAEKNYSLLKDRIIKLKNEGIVPKLVVILIGDNAFSIAFNPPITTDLGAKSPPIASSANFILI